MHAHWKDVNSTELCKAANASRATFPSPNLPSNHCGRFTAFEDFTRMLLCARVVML